MRDYRQQFLLPSSSLRRCLHFSAVFGARVATCERVFWVKVAIAVESLARISFRLKNAQTYFELNVKRNEINSLIPLRCFGFETLRRQKTCFFNFSTEHKHTRQPKPLHNLHLQSIKWLQTRNWFSPPASNAYARIGNRKIRWDEGSPSTFDFPSEANAFDAFAPFIFSRHPPHKAQKWQNYRMQKPKSNRQMEIACESSMALRLFFPFHETSQQIIVNFSFSCNPRSVFAFAFRLQRFVGK